MCTYDKHERFLKGRCQVLREVLRIGLQGVHETKILTCRRRKWLVCCRSFPQLPSVSCLLPAARRFNNGGERCRALY